MSIAIGCESVFDGMGALGDSRLFHHARGTLQCVRQAQKTSKNLLLIPASLQFEHGPVETLQELSCFDAEVLVLIFRHSSGTRRCLNEPDQIARQSRELG